MEVSDNGVAGPVRDRLWTRNYIFMCIANFMMAFSFFLLVPTLPFYLKERFGASQSLVGVILSCYTVAVLSVRPFAGFVADMFPRKRVYIIAMLMFVSAFFGYFTIATTLALFIGLRVYHGLAFGALTTTGNTLVIDIMPSSRRGEGLGYFGVMNNTAMAIGPMVGLFISETGDFRALFWCAACAATTALFFGSLVHAPRRAPAPQPNSTLSVDRFFMVEGIPACLSLFLLAIPYGMTTCYMALYASEVGIASNSGLFFTVMAAGLIVSRLSSGKRVDRGYVTQTIRSGIAIAVFGILGEGVLGAVCERSIAAGYAVYYLSALLIGYGFGTMFPAFNTLFINLAPNNRRATANATYLTGWDVGIGCGMLLGGYISEQMGFSAIYLTGMVLSVGSFLLFTIYVTPHFQRHRLR